MRTVRSRSRLGLVLRLGTLAAMLLSAVSACRLNTTTPPLLAEVTAPAVALDSTLGPLRSQEALARGPLVLLFYRGHW